METSLSGLRGAHMSFELSDGSGVAFARRGAAELGQKAGFNENDLGRVALVVTEASTNVLKHVGHGELLLRTLPAEAPGKSASGIEIIALDKGPGIHDLRNAFVDGRTTAGSPGTGLGAMRRLSDELMIYSQPGLGTVLRAVVRAGAPGERSAITGVAPNGGIDACGVCVPYPGETVSGDAWAIESDPLGLTITLADGLGHGPDAHVAAASAVEVVRRRAGRSPGALMELAHAALHSTRGAALAITRLDLTRGQLTFCGTGNIAAAVFNAERPRLVGDGSRLQSNNAPTEARPMWQLSSRNGTVGHAMRGAQEFEVAWTREVLLVLHSDGIGTRWDLLTYPGLLLQPAAMIAAVLYRDFSRRRDDATVVVVKGKHVQHDLL